MNNTYIYVYIYIYICRVCVYVYIWYNLMVTQIRLSRHNKIYFCGEY